MRARTLYSTIRGILVGALHHGVTSPPEGGAEARVETLAGGAASPPLLRWIIADLASQAPSNATIRRTQRAFRTPPPRA